MSIQKWPKNAFSRFLLTQIWILIRHRKCARFRLVRAHLCTDLYEIWNLCSWDSTWPPTKCSLYLRCLTKIEKQVNKNQENAFLAIFEYTPKSISESEIRMLAMVDESFFRALVKVHFKVAIEFLFIGCWGHPH